MNAFQMTMFILIAIAWAFMMVEYAARILQVCAAARWQRQFSQTDRHADHKRFVKSENVMPVSVLVPAYNNAQSVLEIVRCLLNMQFQEFEIIVINDGSDDNTLLLMKLEFELTALAQPYKRSLKTSEIKAIYRSPLYANLIVVDKPHTNRADALNVGINIANYPVYVTVNADSMMERDALVKIIMPFVNDHRVIAMSGIVRITNGWGIENGYVNRVGFSKGVLGNLVALEYMRTFLSGGAQHDPLGANLNMPGAFCAFQKSVVIQAGGYSQDCLGEDMDLIVRLRRLALEQGRSHVVAFLPNPIGLTQAPHSFSELSEKRRHWHLRFLDAFKKHKDILLKKKYGRLGMVYAPAYWLFDLLGPVVETAGYALLFVAWLTGAVSGLFALSYITVLVLFGVIYSLGALLLEEGAIQRGLSAREMLQMIVYSFLDNLGYRQLNAVICTATLFRFKSLKAKKR